MEKRYDHKKEEEKIYEMWEELDVFSPEKAIKMRKKAGLETKNETFSVLMPPPNANAPLHCGHVTYAIQDIMARFKRMQGYKTLYLPGTDHAGFETQVVYEKKLKKQDKSRFDFDRKTLFENILNFVKENSNMAIDQLKKIGMSADWTRNTFMLDKHVIKTVYDTFIKMHKDNLIYRDMYLVNYSPHHGTTFSNLETTHKETVSPLYYVKYKIKDTNKCITVATVRPETIYADVAIAVNPTDKRYKNLVGKNAINPLNDKELPIIADKQVDAEFGTGALKITPGHDFNDFEIGKEHNLEMISVINLEGKMTKEAPEVAGMRVFSARKRTVEILENKNAVDKIDESYTHNLLVDYKAEKPIEPLLLPNWFVKMDGLSKKALAAIKENKIKFNRPTWKKELLRWLENIHDWPISRQIVFGIRIPVWYNTKETPDIFVVYLDKNGNPHEGPVKNLLKETTLETIKKGLQKLIAPKEATYVVSIKSPGEEYLQETDTFDTWFSSGQWPLTTLKYPNSQDFKEFYPTSFMDSMWDILFFWIARMIIFGLYLVNEIPYKNVYIHGRINDEKGQKMSKSKGNVINPLEFVEKYGADALRMGLVVGGNTAAKETSFSEEKIRGYRNFANKIWNMARFILSSPIPPTPYSSNLELKKADRKMLTELDNTITLVTDNLDRFRFKDAGEAVYQFVWHYLADIYLEQVKDRKDKAISLGVLNYALGTCLKLLHPFMPFVTEAVWEKLPKDVETPLIIANWPSTTQP